MILKENNNSPVVLLGDLSSDIESWISKRVQLKVYNDWIAQHEAQKGLIWVQGQYINQVNLRNALATQITNLENQNLIPETIPANQTDLNAVNVNLALWSNAATRLDPTDVGGLAFAAARVGSLQTVRLGLVNPQAVQNQISQITQSSGVQQSNVNQSGVSQAINNITSSSFIQDYGIYLLVFGIVYFIIKKKK